jgi:hypothetical protein
MMTHVVCQMLYSSVQSVLLGVHDDTCSVPDTVQSSSQFCWVCKMIHEVCRILYSPVQSVMLCVQYDTCSVSVTVQSNTVSSAGCARPYANINSKTDRWVGCIVQCSLIWPIYLTIQVYMLYVEGSNCKFAGCYVIRGGMLHQCIHHTHTHTHWFFLTFNHHIISN